MNLSTTSFKKIEVKKHIQGQANQAYCVSRYDSETNLIICTYIPMHAYVDRKWWNSYGKQHGIDAGAVDKIKIIYHIHHHHHEITEKPIAIDLSKVLHAGFHGMSKFMVLDAGDNEIERCSSDRIQASIFKHFFLKTEYMY